MSSALEPTGAPAPARTALVVDDDDSIRHMITVILRRDGFKVEAVPNGRRALELVARGLQFQLLVTDLLMPEMDGLELLRHLRQHRPDVAVIAMSGGGMLGQAELLLRTADQLGSHAIVMKPFLIEDFRTAVQQTLAAFHHETPSAPEI